jgi:hypothetical protein
VRTEDWDHCTSTKHSVSNYESVTIQKSSFEV